ncbi:hypothetical protein D3C77_256200 [compost metagenome]
MGGIDIHTKARVALDQRDSARGEFARILVDVALVDRQQRLFIGKGIRADICVLVKARWRRGQATGVGRNAAILITTLLRT